MACSGFYVRPPAWIRIVATTEREFVSLAVKVRRAVSVVALAVRVHVSVVAAVERVESVPLTIASVVVPSFANKYSLKQKTT